MSLSITALPAFLRLVRPRGEREDVGFESLASLDAVLTNAPRRVLAVAIGLGLIGALMIPWLRFDSNPLDLRSRKTESVATALDLMKNPQTSPNTVNVLRPSARKRSRHRGPAVEIARSLADADGRHFHSRPPGRKAGGHQPMPPSLLDSTLNPFVTPPPPSDADVVTSLTRTAKALRSAAAKSQEPSAGHARSLADTLDRLAKAQPAVARTRRRGLRAGSEDAARAVARGIASETQLRSRRCRMISSATGCRRPASTASRSSRRATPMTMPCSSASPMR